MSEVSDATQIVLLTARGGYLLGRISIFMAVRTLKLLNTLYHAKWKGKASFNRLRQIKGEDMLFVNVTTEKESLLRLIEAELTAHQIMFARLPDLCGGDGRTQYAVSQADAERFKAFLLDHGTGPNRKVLVGPVRPEDYLATGEDIMKNPTPEMSSLERDARETEHEPRSDRDVRSGMSGRYDSDKHFDRQTSSAAYNRRREEHTNQDREEAVSRRKQVAEDSVVRKPAVSLEAAYREEPASVRDIPEENTEIRIISQGRERIIPTQEFAAEVDRSYPLSMHEKELVYGREHETIRLEPVDEEEHFNLYMLPDGVRAVVIPKEDVRPVYIDEKTGERMPPLFNIFALQRYVIIDPKEGVRDMVRGDDLLSMLKEVPVSVKHAELTQLVKERMEPVAEAVRKSIMPAAEEIKKSVTPVNEAFGKGITPVTEEIKKSITSVTEEITKSITQR